MKTKKAIQCVNPRGSCDRLLFYDTISGTLIRSFDIYQENPYNQYLFGINETNYRNLNYYRLPDTAFVLHPFIEVKRDTKEGKIAVDTPFYASTSASCSAINPQSKHIVVSYRLRLYNKDTNFISAYATYKVFNHKGEIVATFENLPDNSSASCKVSGNGKFLFLVSPWIKPFDEDEENIEFPLKIEVYNTNTKQKIYTEYINESYEPPYPMVVNENMFMIHLQRFNQWTAVKVYDFENGFIYEKKYTTNQFQQLIQVESSGIRFRMNDTEEVFDQYVNFPKQNIVK